MDLWIWWPRDGTILSSTDKDSVGRGWAITGALKRTKDEMSLDMDSNQMRGSVQKFLKINQIDKCLEKKKGPNGWNTTTTTTRWGHLVNMYVLEIWLIELMSEKIKFK